MLPLGGHEYFTCSRCSRKFCQLSRLQSHTHIHDGIQPFSCSLCGFSTSYVSQLRAHLYKEISGRFFACKHCCASFSRLVSVRRHLVQQHGLEILRRARDRYNPAQHALSASVVSNCVEGESREASQQRKVGGRSKAVEDATHTQACTQTRNGIKETLTFNHVLSDVTSVEQTGSLLDFRTSQKFPTLQKSPREKFSQQAEAIVNKLKDATCKLNSQKRAASSLNNNTAIGGPECKLAKPDSANVKDHYCNGTQHAPESSPKDSGIDVSSPWPRELETTDSGSQSGTEQFSHSARSCYSGHFEQNNNSEKPDCMEECPLDDFRECEDTDCSSDVPPVLEKEPPILHMVQPATFFSCFDDEPSDLSEEETMDQMPSSPSSPNCDRFDDSPFLTPDRKLRNDVCLAANDSPNIGFSKVPLDLSYHDSLTVEESSQLTGSPIGSQPDSLLSSQQSSCSSDAQRTVGMDVGMSSLFPDLSDVSSPSSQSSPIARVKKPALAGVGLITVKKPAPAGVQKPASAGVITAKKPAPAGIQKPASAGVITVKKPTSAGVEKPASAGVEKPASAGVEKPALAGVITVKKPAPTGEEKQASEVGTQPKQCNFQSEFAKFLQRDAPKTLSSPSTSTPSPFRKRPALKNSGGSWGLKRRKLVIKDSHSTSCKPGTEKDALWTSESRSSGNQSNQSWSASSALETNPAHCTITSHTAKNLSQSGSPLSMVHESRQHSTCSHCLNINCKHNASWPRFNVKNFTSQQKKVVKLRQLVCRFFKVVFPSIQYPKRFSHKGPVTEHLIDQVIEAATGHKTNKLKALCLDSDIHDVSIVLCKTPRFCLRALRRKIYHLLCVLLPDLTVATEFNTASDDVDRLLRLVLRSNITA